MPDDREEHRQAVALFRFEVLAPVLNEPSDRAAALIRVQAAKVWEIPGSRRMRVAEGTIYDWLRLYRERGFEGLLPKRRSDRAKPRRMPPEVVEAVLSIKADAPELSIREVIRQARKTGAVAAEVPLPPSTLHRLFTREGLMVREQQGPQKDLRRFAFPFAGDLWQADSLHGPAVRDQRGRLRKTYLLATLDDATRVVPHGEFHFNERAPAFLQVLREAVQRRGIPRRLYVDLGACFRCRHLAVICATLGTALIHARAFHPPGKGKIERHFRTTRSQLLSRLEPADTRSLEALNRRYWAWLEGEYHQAPHRGLDKLSPQEKWMQCGERVRHAGPEIDLETVFLFEATRKVSKARTVSLDGRLYEVDAALCGLRVVLRYNPLAPPQRPMQVVHEGKPAGVATPLDLHGNAKVKRGGPSQPLSFRDLEDEDEDEDKDEDKDEDEEEDE